MKQEENGLKIGKRIDFIESQNEIKRYLEKLRSCKDISAKRAVLILSLDTEK